MKTEPDIQYKPQRTAPGDWAFDDGGNRIPALGFDYEAVDSRISSETSQDTFSAADLADAVRIAMQETTVRLLQDLCAGSATDREVGRRAILKLHCVRPESTHKELAERLGLTEGRISQLLMLSKRENANVYGNN